MPYPRASFLSSCLALALAAACGDSSADPDPTPPRDDSDAIAMTALVPNFYDEDYTVELRITPAGSDESLPPQQATVRSEGLALTYGENSADIWTADLELEPGEYVVTFHCFVEDELLCAASYGFTVAPETAELYVVLTFFPECNRIEFPDATAGAKSSCFSDTGFLLSAEIPAATESVAAMRYLLSTTTTDAAWEPLHGGALEPSGNGLADFGQGPVVTETWEATFGVLVAGTDPYALEVTAVDENGDPVCQINTTVDLRFGELNLFHYVIPCWP